MRPPSVQGGRGPGKARPAPGSRQAAGGCQNPGMVTKGQLLERPVAIPAAAGCLDGIYLRGDAPGLVIAPPLPLGGGSMQSAVANELAYAAARARRASLRLDYRGVAGSEGQPTDDLGKNADDLRAGVDFLLETTRSRAVAVAGIGSGCWVALAAARADERVDRVLLVSPPRREGLPPGVPAYAELGRPLLVVVGGRDPLADPAEEEALARGVGRLVVLAEAGTTLREALTPLALLVPPFLGSERPE